MKKNILLIIVCFLFACSPSQDLSKRFPLGDVNIKIAKPQTWQLANGLTVNYLEDSELPLVKASLIFPGGTYFSSPSQQAVVNATGTLIRSGGAGNLSSDKLDLELEKLSASISSSLGTESGSIDFECLANDTDRVISIYADIVKSPRFDIARLKLWKKQASEGIRRRIDDPQTVAGMTVNRVLLPNTVYGYYASIDDVQSVSRLDLLRTHRTFVRPNKAILSVTGAISKEQVAELVDRHFKDWEATQNTVGEIAEPVFDYQPGIYFVEAAFQQSTVMFASPGVPRLSNYDFDIKGFNTVISGGGFSARLLQKLRVELGLIYGGFAAMAQGPRHGKNVIYLQTKSQSTADSIRASRDVVKSLQLAEVSDSELNDMKQAERSGFVFMHESPEKTLSRYSNLKLIGYPDNFDETYLSRIDGVTKPGILNVAKEFWPINKFAIIVVGDAKAYQSLLSLKEDPDFKSFPIKKINFY